MIARSRLFGTISSIVTLFSAIIAVVLVQRHRTQVAATATTQASSSRSTTPGMSGMAGMSAPVNGAITITPAQMRDLGVTFGTVEMRPRAADVRATGVVTFDETRIAQVTPKFNGFIERLYANATGQPVSRGQPLLDIYSPDLLAAQQELLLAEQLQRNIGQAAVPGVPAGNVDLVAAAKRRLELWDISSSQIDEIIRTGKPRRSLTLYSPAAGVVVTKNVVDGQAVTAGQALYTIADVADVWIDVQLREADLAAAHVGASADIDITGLAGQQFKGRVTYVYPTLDTAARAVRARVVVANSGGVLKPGMYAGVRLRNTTRSALTVPTSAILRTGARNMVFVDLGNVSGHGQLKPSEIAIGSSMGDFTEVLSGLEPGQRVVTSAQFLLDSESNLGEVMRSMISQMPSGAR